MASLTLYIGSLVIITQFDDDEPPWQFAIQLTCGHITSFIGYFFFLNNIIWDILFNSSILFDKKNIFNGEFIFSV